MMESKQKITTCCCIDKGNASINVNFEKNAYTPYEIAKCFIEVNNKECQIPIESVTFKLKRKVWAKSSDGHILHLGDATMATQSFSGCAAGEAKPKEHCTLDLNTARESNPYYIEKNRSGKPSYEEEDLAIQREPLQATAIGQIVQVKYYLEILCNYGGLDCCRNLPECELPMTIYAEQLKVPPPQPPIPQGWAPQMMPMVMVPIMPQPAAVYWMQP